MQFIFTWHRARLRLARGLLIGLVVAIIISLLLSGENFITLRTRFQDTFFSGGETTGISSIVAVDDASLAALGRSTVFWDRQAHADLITILTEAKVRVIAFDILFAEPTDHDEALALAIQQAGTGEPGVRLPVNVVQPMAMVVNATSLPDPDQFPTATQFIYPRPIIMEASSFLGHVNIRPDNDGFVRRVPLAIKNENGELIPTLGLASYLAYSKYPADRMTYDVNEVTIAGRTLKAGEGGEMIIFFFGEPTISSHAPNSPFHIYSYIDILCTYRPDANYYLPGFACDERPNAVSVPLEALADQIVLVGVLGATAEPDRFSVPTSTSGEDQMFGVEIHANVIETIHQADPDVRGNFIGNLPIINQNTNSKIAVIFILAILSGLMLPFLRWYAAIFVVPIIYIFYLAIGAYFFRYEGILVELFFPALTLGSVLFGVLLMNYLFEERRRSQINDLFSRYVSPDIARKIVEIADRGELDLSGEERELTVMFADIRGFTTLSEGLTPPEVVALLNTFLEKMNEVVLAHGGAINKYIGDNLMAFWNAPYPQKDHAWQAVQAGLGLLKVVDELNATGQFKARVQFGIGVNTGVVVVGNIGSKQRLEYTPIGDTVNIASRLSGAALGGSMLMGERTFEAINGRIEPVGTDELMLKGKTVAVKAYEFRVSPKEPMPEKK